MLIFDVECRMARAALRMSVRDLADLAKVSTDTIVKIEKGEHLKERTLDAVKTGFSQAGIDFSIEYIYSPSRAHQIAVLSGNSYRDNLSNKIDRRNWTYRSKDQTEYDGRSETSVQLKEVIVSLTINAHVMMACVGGELKG